MLRHQVLSAFGTLPGKGTEIPVRTTAMTVADVQPARAARAHAERAVGTIAVPTTHGRAGPERSVLLEYAAEIEVERFGDRSDSVTTLYMSPCDLLVVGEPKGLVAQIGGERSVEVRVEDGEFGEFTVDSLFPPPFVELFVELDLAALFSIAVKAVESFVYLRQV